MVCGDGGGAFADNIMYELGQWLVCDFPGWLSDLLSMVVTAI